MNHYLPNRVFDRRWWVVLPCVVLLVAYVAISTDALARQMQSASPTIWEIVINVLSDRFIVHHGLTNLFIYAVSNVGVAGQLDMQLLLRLRARRIWLKAIISCVLVIVALYIGLVILSTVVVGLPFAHFSHNWSGYFDAYRESFWLPEVATIWLQLSPVLTITFMAILMSLAWLFMGVVALLVVVVTQRAFFGFLAAWFLNYSALISIDINWLHDYWLARYMFLWNEAVIADSLLLHFLASCLYWVVLIGVMLTVLQYTVLRIDFTAH